MGHALIIARRRWTIRDLLDAVRFPRRRASILPAPWVDELMQKRFGALIVCPPCARKYQDGLRRWAYAAHSDMKAQGNACDFCQAIPVQPVALWFKEERPYPTRMDYAREAVTALAPWPRGFRGDVLRIRRREVGRSLPAGAPPTIILTR